MPRLNQSPQILSIQDNLWNKISGKRGNLKCGPRYKDQSFFPLASQLPVYLGWWELEGALTCPLVQLPPPPPDSGTLGLPARAPRPRQCRRPLAGLLHTPSRGFFTNLIHNLANLATVEAGFLTNIELTDGTYLDN